MDQWDFTIYWNIIPPFGRYRVSDNFILEVLTPENFSTEVYYYDELRPQEITLAYVEVKDVTLNFKSSIRYVTSIVDFFLLVCALIGNFTGIYRGGAGITISNLEELGKHRVLYQTGYKTREYHSSTLEKFQKPINSIKNRFLQLARANKLSMF